MYFERLWMLWFLFISVLLYLLIRRSWSYFASFEKSRQISNFLFKARVPSWRRRIFMGLAKLLSVSFIIIGLADPYIYRPSTKKQYKNIRIIFVTDVSRSMAHAEDIPPNRLVAAKKEIKDFYNSLDGIYKVGILPFSGQPNVYFCPLTQSRNTFLTMLDELTPEVSPTLGTNITRAFEGLEEIVKEEKLDESGLNLIVLLSDGGKEESLATDRIKLFEIIRKLAKKNFRFYCVGVGSTKPTPLVVRDKDGNFVEYLRGENGIDYSKMDEDVLIQIAKAGKGEYVNFNESQKLHSFLEKTIKDNRIADSDIVVYERFYIQSFLFLSSAILLLLVGISNKI